MINYYISKFNSYIGINYSYVGNKKSYAGMKIVCLCLILNNVCYIQTKYTKNILII